jgi:hypothetical protein
MLAAQAIALHHAAMDCFARAMQTGAEDHATATRLHRNAASLTRAFTATLQTLQRCQAQEAREDHMQPEPPQPRPQPQPHQPAPQPQRLRQTAQQDPMQREPAAEAPPLSHGPEEDLMHRENPAPRRWEDLTEAEQFAILYPERVAAGATSHEDADLWLPKFTRQPAPLPAGR